VVVSEQQAATAGGGIETAPTRFVQGLNNHGANQCWFNSLFIALTVALLDMQSPQADDLTLGLVDPIGQHWKDVVCLLMAGKDTDDKKAALLKLIQQQSVMQSNREFWTGLGQQDPEEAYTCLLETQPNGCTLVENTAIEAVPSYDHGEKCRSKSGTKWESDQRDVMKTLSLALSTENTSTAVDLQKLVDDHFKPEKNVTVHCAMCQKKNATVERTIRITLVPSLLVIHLKRFTGGNGFTFKQDQPVNCSLTIRIPVSEKGEPLSFATYELVAEINHRGTVKGGHYVTLVRPKDVTAPSKQYWEEYDDSAVQKWSEGFRPARETYRSTPSAPCFTPYLLFYRRVSKEQPWDGTHPVVVSKQRCKMRIERYIADIALSCKTIAAAAKGAREKAQKLNELISRSENYLPALQAATSATASTSLQAASAADDPNPFHAVEKKLDEYKSTLRNKIVNLNAPSHQVDGIALKAETFTAALLRQL
jgi:ubiquitin C-terminal hydrolase